MPNKRFDSGMASADLATAVYSTYNIDHIINVCDDTRHAAQPCR